MYFISEADNFKTVDQCYVVWLLEKRVSQYIPAMDQTLCLFDHNHSCYREPAPALDPGPISLPHFSTMFSSGTHLVCHIWFPLTSMWHIGCQMQRLSDAWKTSNTYFKSKTWDEHPGQYLFNLARFVQFPTAAPHTYQNMYRMCMPLIVLTREPVRARTSISKKQWLEKENSL